MTGRGTTLNPTGRFEQLRVEIDPDLPPDERPSPKTLFLKDTSKSLLTWNDSPDIPFRASINPYRGCEHGCAYCFARPTHEYLGFSAGLDFETKIMVKLDAARLLREELARPGWEPQMVAISGVTDCYQPAERRFRLTRQCLEVFLECRNPVGIVTKNSLVTRDLDILSDLARCQCASVYISLTTLKSGLAHKLEPRAASPRQRLETITRLREAGVPVSVITAPIIPGLNDEEIPALLKAAAEAGALNASYVLLRLPHSVKTIFRDWVRTHVPLKESRIFGLVESTRGGKEYDAKFGQRMRGTGNYADQIAQLFQIAKAKAGLGRERAELSTCNFRRPAGNQLTFGW
jgi:DNA repair photolyase